MTRLFVVVQTVIRGARIEMETLLGHMQWFRTRGGCRKSQKNPREVVAGHKNGKKCDFWRWRGTTGVKEDLLAWGESGGRGAW